eukprot:SAG31_NODE_7142_length_1778_cov_4.270399_3_plen_59_part_00
MDGAGSLALTHFTTNPATNIDAALVYRPMNGSKIADVPKELRPSFSLRVFGMRTGYIQ